MQKCKFPMETLRVTQGYGRYENGNVDYTSYSHTGSYALDLGGKDLGQDWAYAPCDIVVKRVYGEYNAVWFETLEKVLCADGVARQLVFMLLHINDADRDALGITVGKVFRYGEKFYREGTAGQATGNHIHLEVGEAPFTPTGWVKTAVKDRTGAYIWKINNQLKPHEVFILGEDVQIANGGGYRWKRVLNFEADDEQTIPPATDEESRTKYGVDVSHNRSEGIMAKIKAKGKAEFAILRATVGSVEQDANLAQYIKDSQGMKLGFFSANYFNSVEDAQAEADYLVDTIQAYGFTPEKVDLPLFCDWEYFSNEWNKAHGYVVTPLLLQEMTVAFCQRIRDRGYRAGVYLNYDFWKNWYGDDFFTDNPELFIWYARPGYAKPDRDCYIWQYAANNGAEYGPDEDLDKNILLGEYIVHSPEREDEGTASCEERIAELEKQLADANEKLDAAAELLLLEDNCIRELRSKVAELERAVEDTNACAEKAAALEKENGVLKETIVSLQEKVEELTEENKQLKTAQSPEETDPMQGSQGGFFSKLWDIFFGGA